MNYYNPYFFSTPTSLYQTPRIGLLSRLFGSSGVTFGGILNGTQRVLSFANQAIPFVKQVRPIIGNAKTMFKVMNEFKRSEKLTNNNTVNNTKNNSAYRQANTVQNNYISTDEGPTFFM